MKAGVVLFAVGIAAASAATSAQTAAPISQAIRASWDGAKKNMKESADLMAEADYSFKPAGTVLTQSPGGGARLRLGSAVTLGVSNGKGEAVAIPGVKRICASRPIRPAAWIMRTTTGSSSAVKRARSASPRMVAKDCR